MWVNLSPALAPLKSSLRLAGRVLVARPGDQAAARDMSDNEDVQLPIPSRSTGVYASGVNSLRSGRGGTAGAAAAAGRSSRKVVEGLRSASTRRLNYSSFTSNGSNKGINGENTGGSATAGSIAGPGRGGGGGTQSKSCSACGIQFTWRMRRHHCRGCKKVRLRLFYIVGGACGRAHHHHRGVGVSWVGV